MTENINFRRLFDESLSGIKGNYPFPDNETFSAMVKARAAQPYAAEDPDVKRLTEIEVPEIDVRRYRAVSAAAWAAAAAVAIGGTAAVTRAVTGADIRSAYSDNGNSAAYDPLADNSDAPEINYALKAYKGDDRYIGFFRDINGGGELRETVADGVAGVSFVDFGNDFSMTTVLDKFGFCDLPFVYDGSVYYFRDDLGRAVVIEKAEPYASTDNAQEIARFPGMMLNDIGVELVGSTLYFPLVKETTDEDGRTVYEENFLYCCDLSTGESRELGRLNADVYAGAVTAGYYNGKVYFIAHSLDRSVEQGEDVYDELTKELYAYDIAAGMLELSDLPLPLRVQDNTFVCDTPEGIAILTPEGETQIIGGFHSLRGNPPDIAAGKVFFCDEDMCYDISSRTMTPINRSALDTDGNLALYEIAAAYKGKFIVRVHSFADGQRGNGARLRTAYAVISPEELIPE